MVAKSADGRREAAIVVRSTDGCRPVPLVPQGRANLPSNYIAAPACIYWLLDIKLAEIP